MQPAKAEDIFNKHALLYQTRFMDVSMYADSLDAFIDFLPQKASVLELACGPGNITKYVLDKRPELQILGTDIAPNMLELAKINNPTADFELMDCRNIRFKQAFHAVICGFCLPYLSETEAEKLVAACFQVLEPNGMLYLSTMEENEYHASGIKTNSHGEKIYVHYHKVGFLTETLTKNKFKILGTYRKYTPAEDGSSTTDLVLIAQKAGIVFE